MSGVQLEEVDIKDESIQVKEETTEEPVEILEPFEHIFLCTICGTALSKTVSCDDNGDFKTEVILCTNQDCGKTFESEIKLEPPAESCQVTDPLLIKTAAIQDEDYYLLRPNLRKCNDCQKEFMTKLLYLHHMRLFHSDLIKCSFSFCSKFFRKQTDLEEHRMKHHKDSVTCAICGKDLSSKLSLHYHFISLHLQKKKKGRITERSSTQEVHGSTAGKTECPYCCQFYKHLKEHISKYHPVKINCTHPKCKRTFRSVETMQEHAQTIHNKPAKTCNICHRIFSTNQALKMHIANKHQPKKSGKTKCMYCGEFVKLIIDHVRKVHPDKLLQCTGCNNVFVTENNLRDHFQHFHAHLDNLPQTSCNKTEVKLQNHKPKDNTFNKKCILCAKVFNDKKLYIQHVNSCLQSKKIFKCSFPGCVHWFMSQVEMEKHHKGNHLQEKCDLCRFQAPTREELLQHLKKTHCLNVYVQPNLAQVSYHCASCLKDIPVLQMKTHKKDASCLRCNKHLPCRGLMNVHKETCDLKCLVCHIKFKNKLYLDKHEMGHNKPGASCELNQTFRCKACNLYFASIEEFRVHLMLVHWKKIKLRSVV